MIKHHTSKYKIRTSLNSLLTKIYIKTKINKYIAKNAMRSGYACDAVLRSSACVGMGVGVCAFAQSGACAGFWQVACAGCDAVGVCM